MEPNNALWRPASTARFFLTRYEIQISKHWGSRFRNRVQILVWRDMRRWLPRSSDSLLRHSKTSDVSASWRLNLLPLMMLSLHSSMVQSQMPGCDAFSKMSRCPLRWPPPWELLLMDGVEWTLPSSTTLATLRFTPLSQPHSRRQQPR